MDVEPKLGIKIVRAAVCLHNFTLSRQARINLRDRKVRRRLERYAVPKGCRRLNPAEPNNAVENNAVKIRDELMQYFTEEGEVLWQWDRSNDF